MILRPLQEWSLIRTPGFEHSKPTDPHPRSHAPEPRLSRDHCPETIVPRPLSRDHCPEPMMYLSCQRLHSVSRVAGAAVSPAVECRMMTGRSSSSQSLTARLEASAILRTRSTKASSAGDSKVASSSLTPRSGLESDRGTTRSHCARTRSKDEGAIEPSPRSDQISSVDI